MPSSVHAVSCSLPTMADVIGYEEKRPETVKQVRTGYPRFVTHYLVEEVADFLRKKQGLAGRDVMVVASEKTAADLRDYCRREDAEVEVVADEGLAAVHCVAGTPASLLARKYIQHTGSGISSRRAEDFLIARGLLGTRQEEETVTDDPSAVVTAELGAAFGCDPGNIILALSGMHAFYAAFRALNEIQAPRGRDTWIQFGWLYVDTIEILRKLTGAPERHVYYRNVFDLQALEAFLEENGKRVAGLVTEMPTNPRVETPRADRLKELAGRHGIPVVIDPTLASPYNIDVLPFADIAVNSLTKYAASEGDVLAGAVVINPASAWAAELREAIEKTREPLYHREAGRLAFQMRSYRQVIRTINSNTTALVSFLESHPSVKKVLWAREKRSAPNYDRLATREAGPGGIITIELNIPLARFYDSLPVMKGPSFGTVFTLACPFMYLAHYDLVSTDEGRERLRAEGIDPDLVRVSVGTEPASDIIAAFEEALR